MHKPFDAYVAYGKTLASARGLEWSFPLDSHGFSDNGWNLTEAIGARPPPTHYFRDLGLESKTLENLNQNSPNANFKKSPLDPDWQDLIKAAVCDNLFSKNNTTIHTVNGVIRPLKVLATYCILKHAAKPWNVTPAMVDEAVAIAVEMQKSGQLADTIIGVTKTIIDLNHLAIASPLTHALTVKKKNGSSRDRRSRIFKSQEDLLSDLEQRKHHEKLPERKAFWELVRIIFTEHPKSFSDDIRFSILKVILLTGLRVTEAVTIPHDWKRSREYFDPKGIPAGELGGYSNSMLLRHFAEKQRTGDASQWYENIQFVPKAFEEILEETLDHVSAITQPLRDTLKLQCKTGRLLPWYSPFDLVPITELYTRLTGNPFWLKLPKNKAENFIEEYRHNYSPQVLHDLNEYQDRNYGFGLNTLDPAVYVFFHRFIKQASHMVPLRYANGNIYSGDRINWSSVYLKIDELESFLTTKLPTKLPDVAPIKLTNGAEFQSWEFMFLTPKRSLAEERNEGITDVSRCYSIGAPDSSLILTALGEALDRESIFKRYGATPEDQSLTLISHSFRHLQNTELFRLGVADTIITKRFNRRSVAQSYEYDHRQLAETLDQIDVPDALEAFLGEKATTVAKLIQTGMASGPIVEKFKYLQREQGDEFAFNFLRVEADGFHATPYGHCINSFTVDPCPKNLECFAGCNHLTATNLPENQKNLENLQHKFEVALSEIQSRPKSTIGRENQISHATVRLENIRKLLSTPTGKKAFPNGKDLSQAARYRSPLDE